MKIRVGVIFGGASVEHEVSIISALQAISNIDKEKYDAVPIYISKDRIWYTGSYLSDIKNYNNLDNVKKNSKAVTLCKINNEFVLLSTSNLLSRVVDKIDVAFPIVHGQSVEDGTLAGFLDTVGIPYVGCNVLGAALGQDKVVMKQIFNTAGIPTVDYVWFYENDFLNNQTGILKQIKELGYPVVVKPASLGSSVGIKFVKDELEAIEAITDAFVYDKKVVVEKAVENLVEVNCSVVGNHELQETSEIEEVLSDNSILTFEDKYIGDDKTKSTGSKGMINTSRIIPAKIDKDLYEAVELISKDVFKVLNLSGVCRIDFLIDTKNKKVYVNEPNTIPGSLAFYLWEAKGKKYSKLLDDIITLGIKDYKNKEKKISHFDSNILKNFNGCKGAKK